MISTKQIMDSTKDTETPGGKERFSLDDAKRIGEALGISWNKFDIDQFWMGLNVEVDRAKHEAAADVTHGDPMVTGKIALAHLNETPDYYINHRGEHHA